MTTLNIKPIETQYNGYKFRSRLEARWAVFFDEMGIEYEYEKEGFEITDRGNWQYSNPEYDINRSKNKTWWYLPDFYLPKSKTWVDVKGDLESVELEYYEMLIQAVDWGDQLPSTKNSCGTGRGLLILSSIPHPSPRGKWTYPCIQNYEGVGVYGVNFKENIGIEYHGFECWGDGLVDGYDDPYYDQAAHMLKKIVMKYPHDLPYKCSEIERKAYCRARQARFERR